MYNVHILWGGGGGKEVSPILNDCGGSIYNLLEFKYTKFPFPGNTGHIHKSHQKPTSNPRPTELHVCDPGLGIHHLPLPPQSNCYIIIIHAHSGAYHEWPPPTANQKPSLGASYWSEPVVAGGGEIDNYIIIIIKNNHLSLDEPWAVIGILSLFFNVSRAYTIKTAKRYMYMY